MSPLAHFPPLFTFTSTHGIGRTVFGAIYTAFLVQTLGNRCGAAQSVLADIVQKVEQAEPGKFRFFSFLMLHTNRIEMLIIIRK